MIPIENQRLRELREELGYTQTEFAAMIGAGSSTVDIERGKVKLNGVVVKELYRRFGINPIWLFGENTHKRIREEKLTVMPRVITVDAEGLENIVLVSQKAAAGYGLNIEDSQWLSALPQFQIPLPEYRNSSFRGFEVQGDSMLPLVKDKSWVICSAVESLDQIKNNEIYVIVEQESIRLKVIQKDDMQKKLKLISLNPEYAEMETEYENVVEVWHFHSQLNFGKNNDLITLNQIYTEIQEIKQKLM
ncbi:MAG: LexA family transcriptional regulator [Flavobacteriaceae bacterium]|nr:LexA family transcriptional regulator [Flavobacteriaceae bacterium]